MQTAIPKNSAVVCSFDFHVGFLAPPLDSSLRSIASDPWKNHATDRPLITMSDDFGVEPYYNQLPSDGAIAV